MHIVISALAGVLLIFSFLIAKAAGNGFRSELSTNQKINLANNHQFSTNIEDYDIGKLFTFEESGQASWYGRRFHNRKTANGERFNMHDLTAAHKSLPFGTLIRVKNEETGKVTFVRVNDRGPFVRKRIIDLSYGAASEIKGVGTPDVKIDALINNGNLPMIDNDDYFFGYSYDLPLSCIPSNTIRFTAESNDLSVAITQYEDALKQYPGKPVFLFTPTSEDSHIPAVAYEKYYIGYFEPNQKDFKNSLVDNK